METTKTTYTTFGSCARFIDIELIEDRIASVRFIGGCTGNTLGLSSLLEGMPAAEAVPRLRGIVCRNGTSCPDQLARALQGMLLEQAS
jgi:uncharacterized protein (TIGR03905 family)